MVRAYADMRADRRGRHEQRCAVLDAQTLLCVGIVRSPDLRRIIQHTRIESCAAAGAAFQQDIRIFGDKALQHLIDAEHIGMVKRRRRDLGQLPVHVPLDIGDRNRVEDLLHLRPDCIAHIAPRIIQHILRSGLRARSALDADGIIRMCAEQIAVRRDHLRLEPEPEAHPLSGDVVGQRLQPAGELPLIRHPVAERAVIAVASAEPAVIQHEQLNAETGGFIRDRFQLFKVKVKVGRFPVVDQHRPFRIAVFRPDQMIGKEPVECAGHSAETVCTVNEDSLRRIKFRFGAETVRKAACLNADLCACLAELCQLGLRREIAGIDQRKAVGLAGFLGRFGAHQREKRAVLM